MEMERGVKLFFHFSAAERSRELVYEGIRVESNLVYGEERAYGPTGVFIILI